jgi:ABC-type Fe3+-siderophore transport system permease subunit
MREHKSSSDRFVIKFTIAAIMLICVMAVSCCLGSSDITLADVIKYFTGRGDELAKTTLTIIGRIEEPSPRRPPTTQSISPARRWKRLQIESRISPYSTTDSLSV